MHLFRDHRTRTGRNVFGGYMKSYEVFTRIFNEVLKTEIQADSFDDARLVLDSMTIDEIFKCSKIQGFSERAILKVVGK